MLAKTRHLGASCPHEPQHSDCHHIRAWEVLAGAHCPWEGISDLALWETVTRFWFLSSQVFIMPLSPHWPWTTFSALPCCLSRYQGHLRCQASRVLTLLLCRRQGQKGGGQGQPQDRRHPFQELRHAGHSATCRLSMQRSWGDPGTIRGMEGVPLTAGVRRELGNSHQLAHDLYQAPCIP